MKDNGGSAFPVTPRDKSVQIAPTERGMTLRDWFAGMAMQAFTSTYPNGETCAAMDIASDAYAMADAMLEARKEGA